MEKVIVCKTRKIGKIIPLFFLPLISLFYIIFYPTNNTFATTSTLTVSITNSISLNLFLDSSASTFATSDTSTSNISIKTNNGTGYTLGIKASTNNVNNNQLINTSDNTKYFSSITSPVSESDYSNDSYATSNNLDDTWGYRPSKLNSASNSNYLPVPTSDSTPTILDQTSTANPTAANTYNVAIGARASNAITPGTYTNTFIFTVVSNPITYSITYNQNATDTVTDMPTNISNQETYGDMVNISNTIPIRDRFDFKGWCTIQTADGASCTGTTYNPNGEGTSLAWAIDQTTPSNTLELYAMWQSNYTDQCTLNNIPDANCMQKMTSCSTTATTVMDARDGSTYLVQKLDDDVCWMLDNLRLDPTTITLAALKTDTNASNATLTYFKNGGGRNPYPADGVSSNWTSSSQDSYVLPFVYSSNKNTTATGYGAGSKKVGVYYNYCAASAGSYCKSSGVGNASEDICPAGWRMPIGSTIGEFYNLCNILNGSDCNESGTTPMNATNSNSLQYKLSLNLSGSFYSGSTHMKNTYGYYWSVTRWSSSSTNMYTYSISSTTVTPSGTLERYLGLPIRCRLK